MDTGCHTKPRGPTCSLHGQEGHVIASLYRCTGDILAFQVSVKTVILWSRKGIDH